MDLVELAPGMSPAGDLDDRSCTTRDRLDLPNCGYAVSRHAGSTKERSPVSDLKSMWDH